MNCREISVALVTRVQRCEAPFLNEFLEYYRRLGIDRFYLINTEAAHREFIALEIAPEYREVVELLDKRPEDGLNECPNCALTRVSEKFLLHVDMDEFLYLDGMTLHEFIHREGLREGNAEFVECFFYWIMSPLCRERYASSIREIVAKKYYFPSKDGKCFARTQDIVAIKPHLLELAGRKKQIRYDPESSNCFIFHVSARGIYDIINKVQYGQYSNLKKSHDPAKELYELILDKASGNLPSRFVLLSFQSRFAHHVMDLGVEFPELAHRTNTELLKEITLDGLKELLGIEIAEEYLERAVLEKIDGYEIPAQLVDLYAAGRINLLNALKYLLAPKNGRRLGNKSQMVEY